MVGRTLVQHLVMHQFPNLSRLSALLMVGAGAWSWLQMSLVRTLLVSAAFSFLSFGLARVLPGGGMLAPFISGGVVTVVQAYALPPNFDVFLESLLISLAPMLLLLEGIQTVRIFMRVSRGLVSHIHERPLEVKLTILGISAAAYAFTIYNLVHFCGTQNLAEASILLVLVLAIVTMAVLTYTVDDGVIMDAALLSLFATLLLRTVFISPPTPGAPRTLLDWWHTGWEVQWDWKKLAMHAATLAQGARLEDFATLHFVMSVLWALFTSQWLVGEGNEYGIQPWYSSPLFVNAISVVAIAQRTVAVLRRVDETFFRGVEALGAVAYYLVYLVAEHRNQAPQYF